MMNLERCGVAYSFQGPYGFCETRIPEFDVSSNTVKDKDNGDHQGSVKILRRYFLCFFYDYAYESMFYNQGCCYCK